MIIKILVTITILIILIKYLDVLISKILKAVIFPIHRAIQRKKWKKEIIKEEMQKK